MNRIGILATVVVVVVVLIVVAVAYLLYTPRYVPYTPRGGGKAVLVGRIGSLVKGRPASMKLRVSAFSNGSTIPVKYTCDGEDVSPRVEIGGVPQGAESLILVMYDPDAPGGVFYHWGIYNIPTTVGALPEDLPKKAQTSYGIQVKNDFGGTGYGGPCPPAGRGSHRYVLIVIALDTKLGGDINSVRELLDAAEGHVIAYGIYIGLYGR